MQKILFSFFLVGLLFLSFSQNQPGTGLAMQLNAYATANKLFQQAEKQSLEAGDNEQLQARADETYHRALVAFTILIPAVEKAGHDSLSFFTRLKTGFIAYYFDSINTAKTDYLAAITLKMKLPSVADSFLFIPCLFTGGIYYTQNQFDSAFFYYRKAEQILEKYNQPLNHSQRLYNRLGAMYYETGNYRQARNYFEKAITLTNPADKILLDNYKINIASLLIKLEEFEPAKMIYEGLLPSRAYENEIYHNLAIISLKQQDYKKAISYLRQVNYADNKKSIDLYYNFGVAYSELNEKDSSEFYLQRAIAENVKWNGRRKNIPYGLVLKYQADELVKQQLFKEATELYQQAVMQFLDNFKEPDIYKNPEEFSGVISFINLFKTLAAKASAFENWYQHEHDIELLKASLNAYQAAFKLADYVEKTYASDEALLFPGKIKYTVHSKPINVSLLLYDRTKKRNYLEEAYLFDQRNKASTIAFNKRENELKNETGKANLRTGQEISLKTSITRLSLNAAQATDSAALSQIHTAIRDNEIKLGKLQE
ncbi:MAG: tetratricopeptide repeat protein, partial [Ferruginibacter sp.]|nr:tetratricopeptide repeat protein [Chitinophagaceae bacterium]